MSFPSRRLRRLRRTPAMRRLVAETTLSPSDLIAPLFVREGISKPEPIASLPGVSQHTLDSLRSEVVELRSRGIGAVILFGVPANKDSVGSEAYNPDGIVQVALSQLRAEVGSEMVLIADLCIDEYTDHGHCGILRTGGAEASATKSRGATKSEVGQAGHATDSTVDTDTIDTDTIDTTPIDNDTTLEIYARIAVAQASAGADIVAPSGMMDGQVSAIRSALEENGHTDTAILAYAAKYASALYGPFREAVNVQLPPGADRRSYQQDWRNSREALEEIRLDLAEGADMIMVKPAVTYLDVIAKARQIVNAPVGAYHVSGEYAMIKAAGANGWIDAGEVAMEQLTAIKRAGADFILTYFAAEIAEALA